LLAADTPYNPIYSFAIQQYKHKDMPVLYSGSCSDQKARHNMTDETKTSTTRHKSAFLIKFNFSATENFSS
jgi:hypothetical protein